MEGLENIAGNAIQRHEEDLRTPLFYDRELLIVETDRYRREGDYQGREIDKISAICAYFANWVPFMH